jgi:hypothetical protein
MTQPNTAPTYNPSQFARDPREAAAEAERQGDTFVDAGDKAAVDAELKADDPQKGAK